MPERSNIALLALSQNPKGQHVVITECAEHRLVTTGRQDKTRIILREEPAITTSIREITDHRPGAFLSTLLSQVTYVDVLDTQ